MIKEEIKQLLTMINDNEDGYTFSEESWLVKTVLEILEDSQIDTINIYGKREIDALKEDISSLGTEITIDVDNNFTSARTSKIELYTPESNDSQFIEFEITNLVSFLYKDKNIEIIKDEKESEEVSFDEDSELLLRRTDFIYTSDRGLDVKKILDIYIPYYIREILDEEADY